MPDSNDKMFSIQIAAQMAGLSAHTIRAWEKRYKAITPSRTDNGRRLYSAAEVDRLILLAQLTHIGSNIGQIANLSENDLKSMYAKVMQSGVILPAAPITRDINLVEMKKQLLDSIANYEVSIISQLLSQAKNAVEPRTFALEILKPLIEEVRIKFEKNQFQHAQMLALLAIARFHAGNIIYSHIEKSIKSSHKFILTGMEKEMHSFGLLYAALLCCHHKKHFFYLNTNLPVASIVEAVKATEGSVLILSVSKDNHRDIQSTVNTVMEELPNVKIWLVGQTNENIKNTKMIENAEALDVVLEKF